MVDFEEKLERFKQAVDKIIAKAEEDGVITPEELAILDTAKRSVKTYEETVKTALEDNLIDNDELQKLLELEEDLLADTYFVAMDDEKIDDDELLLLQTLIKSMDPKASLSWLEEDRQ